MRSIGPPRATPWAGPSNRQLAHSLVDRLISHRAFAVGVLGIFGWATFSLMIASGLRYSPPSTAFDLELLLRGARRVAQGIGPYEPAMLAGGPVDITSLFYSYPPLVAQALAPVAGVPLPIIVAVLIAVAASLTSAVAGSLSNEYGYPTRGVAMAVLALLPFWYPIALAMLFGNLDMVFPAVYGVVLLWAIGRPTPSRTIVAGLALAFATATKLHPAVLILWLLARAFREHRSGMTDGRRIPPSLRVALVALGAGIAIVATSVAIGGVQPWLDYAAVARASSMVHLLDPRNLGPAVQIVMALGLDSASVQPIQAVTIVVASAVTIISAMAVDDPLESLLWAAVASVVVLPVTWYHHFAILLPFAIVAIARALRSRTADRFKLVTVATAGALTAGLFFGTVGTWLLVPIAFALVRMGRPASASPQAAVGAGSVPG